MISQFKEKPDGGYYCSECHMSFGEPQTACPYCGSIVSNYEELITVKEPSEIIIGGRWWENYQPGFRASIGAIDDYCGDELDYELLKKVVEKVKEQKK